jgi:hypothetical protein
MNDQAARENATRQRLLKLAQIFMKHVDEPSDDDMETLFWLLINRQVSKLEAFVKSATIKETP